MFMRPVVTFDTWITYQDSSGETHQCPASDFTPDMGEEIERVDGWSGRLSAPGYLDCTEWCGVHETATAAYRALASGESDDPEADHDETGAVWCALRVQCAEWDMDRAAYTWIESLK